jgi:hypothetical protein
MPPLNIAAEHDLAIWSFGPDGGFGFTIVATPRGQDDQISTSPM